MRATPPGSLHPCSGCGYMMRGGPTCGDCIEYGAPRGWRWQYDVQSGKHSKVFRGETPR